jgi:hypothetical protein
VVQRPPSATTCADAGKQARRDTVRHAHADKQTSHEAVVLQVAEGVDLVVDAATVAGLVIWEADSIGQEQPFSPILPVAVLLVRTKSQGESRHEQSVNERQKDAEGGGTDDRGEDKVGSTVKPSKDWR